MRPGQRREQIRHGLRRLDVADLLEQLDAVAGADLPVEKVHVLHQPDGVGREAEAAASVLRGRHHMWLRA